MTKFTRSITTNGKFKDLTTNGSVFIDAESGEVVDLAAVLFEIYKDTEFDLSVTQKNDVALD